MKYPDFSNAACKGVDTNSFYHEDTSTTLQNISTIKKMCSNCYCVDDCREWGIHKEEFGLWGGLLPIERRRERIRRNIILSRIHYITDETIIALRRFANRL